MKDLAQLTLTQVGHTVQESDLYAMNFNPIASAADFRTRAKADDLERRVV